MTPSPLHARIRIRRATTRRSAFTLLELVIALALTVLLVTGIYGALSIYMRVSSEDNARLEHSRLARALFRQMSLDIQSVVFRPGDESSSEEDASTEEGSTTGGTSSGGSSSSSSSSSSGTAAGGTLTTMADATATEEAPVVSVGLIGDSVKLVLHVSRPSRDLSYEPLFASAGVHARTSDLQSVTYFLADPRASGLEGVVGQNALQGGLSDPDAMRVQGLARLAGDELAVHFADLASDVDALAASARIIAPEVASIDFQYFDGLSWVAEWDSVAMGRLPNAVAITAGFRYVPTEEEKEAARLNRFSRQQIDLQEEYIEYRRHVVSLPLAESSMGAL